MIYRSVIYIFSLITLLSHQTFAEDSFGSGKLSRGLEFKTDKELRTYNLYIPEGLEKTPRPVVLLLHGHGGSADQIIGANGRKSPYKMWIQIADRDKIILIIPDGLAESKGKQGWNDARGVKTNPDSDDVGFLRNLVEHISKSFPVDRKRIYVMGTSNGGHMSLRLAAEESSFYAAVAAVAASNPVNGFINKPEKPISVLLMNGTQDKIFPYNGGKMAGKRGSVLSTEKSIAYWIEHNQCPEKGVVQQFPDNSKRDESTVMSKTYKNESTSVEVKLYQVSGGGHTEPSLKEHYSRIYLAIVGPQNKDIEMADEIWKFFKDKTR